MPPAHTSEASIHEVRAVVDNVLKKLLRNEIVVVQFHEDALRGHKSTTYVSGILPDAGMPMGKPIFCGDMPPKISQHLLLRGHIALLQQYVHVQA